MRLVVGGDHAGYPLKRKMVEMLRSWGHDVTDVGTHSQDPVDFPDIAEELCEMIRTGQAERGIMICGTGVGASIAANKFPGIRAALCHDIYCAHQSVEHDDANVMCLGAWVVGEKLAYDLVQAYLNARHSQENEFQRRVAKLAEIEKRYGGA
ncbi:ribose 5-phosphate isomerase B [Limnochorda pilosa]|uniref:Ribose 5-phosphate isomerase n=1 Tax=Limnochorda pilosa TaxID=1555112 RepID=A0A0K2SLC4_LIMPI|nr:ribose 5-phosphate isomerase B [Limnochorda pilosa]BAS27918.1 ribose 5-phosphate isomerase [Limnochorda pilosa]